MDLSETGILIGDRYRLHKKIGEGGMAVVYKGVDERLRQTVAIKLLSSQYSSDQSFVEHFLREASTAAQAGSYDKRHMATVKDCGKSERGCYIVMDYVDGPNLKFLLNEFGVFSAYETVRIASQVCSALESAHKLGIIHRDIKPSNLMMQRSTGEIMLMDFGVAISGDARGSQESGVMGTLQYMSPEQARGDNLVRQSDIYSLGISMYELSCGKPPFSSKEVMRAAKKKEALTCEAPTAVRSELDAEFDEIIFTCLQTNPEDRYSSARKMRDALDQYLDTHSSEMYPAQNKPTENWAVQFVTKTQSTGEIIALTKPTVVGRDDGVDLPLSSSAVSRRHARLTPMGTFLKVEDLDSKNCTLINGNPVREHARCFPGDIVTIGYTRLMVGCKR